MNDKPKVSVILTSYNHAKYLKEAINSVLNQTYTNFELIIWDDGSIDDSWEIIMGYKDRRIRPFRNNENERGVYGINKAIQENAQGEYIAIHHSDDIWEQSKLEKQVNFLDSHPGIGAVFSRALIVDENNKSFMDKSHVYYNIFKQHNRNRFEWLNRFFTQGNALCHPSILIRKECYENCGNYRYGLSLLPDLDMWVRLCLKYEIHVLPEKLVRFRVRDGEKNTSTGSEKHASRPFEFLQVMNNYRSIKSPEEFIHIFPEAKKYVKPSGFVLHFALGMISISSREDKFAKLFGLNLLFELMNDPDHASKIHKIYNFGHKEFTSLVTQQDVFSIQELLPTDSSPRSNNNDNQTALLSKQLQVMERELHQIYSSKAWKLALGVRKLRLTLIPQGGRLEKVLRFLFKFW